MALTNTQVTALTDSVAKALTDFNTNFVTGTATITTTINSGVGGTGASSATLGRVLAYASVPDAADELALLPKANIVASNVAAYLSGVRALNSLYLQYMPLLDALDTAQSGLNAFLTTNTLQINAFAATAFNYYQANATTLGFRSPSNIPVAIATANFFPFATTDTMWGFTSSGATTFSANTVGVNTSTAVNGGGVGQVYIYKNNAVAAVGGATFTITYTNAAGTPAIATYSTVSGTPAASGSLATGYVVSGAIAQAITSVSGTGMTSGEQYTLGIQLVRTAAY